MNDVRKEPFRFEYTMPALDWYEIKTVEINYDDYVYFELQRRYGKNWWLIGKIPPPKNSDDYRWTTKEIGRISTRDIARFVEWAKTDLGGSRITNISAISGAIDLMREIKNLLPCTDGVKRAVHPASTTR